MISVGLVIQRGATGIYLYLNSRVFRFDARIWVIFIPEPTTTAAAAAVAIDYLLSSIVATDRRPLFNWYYILRRTDGRN